MADYPTCERCNDPTEFFGRISLPPTMIYRCKTCGDEMWVKEAPPARSRLPDQPQAQQQQQPQQDDKKKE
jgi:DNA-directed RNA polymerase subunit RPC12/RpoP